MATGLVIDAAGFEVLAGDERVGSRRAIVSADVEFLTELASRYVRAVQAGSDAGVFTGLGRELYRWLDGDQGQLSSLLERAARPRGVRGGGAAGAVTGGAGGAACSV